MPIRTTRTTLTTRLCLLTVAAFACQPAARADVSYATDRVTYYVLPGASITVHASMRFSGPDVATLAAEHGLYSAGLSVSIETSGPSATPAVIADAAAILPNVLDFDDPFGPVIDPGTTPRAGILLLTDPFDTDGDLGVLGAPAAGVRTVALADLVFTAGPNLGESTVILIDDYDPGFSDTVTWETFQVLDASLAPLRIAIVVVPNPACVADWNNSGDVNSQDFFDFIVDYFRDAADFNGLDGTNSQDFFDFLTAFFTGC